MYISSQNVLKNLPELEFTHPPHPLFTAAFLFVVWKSSWNSMCWKRPQKIISEKEKGSLPRWAYLAACLVTTWKRPVVGPLSCLWGGFSSDWLLSQFLFYIEIKPLPVQPVSIALCLFPYGSLWREILWSPCRHPLSTVILWWGISEPSFLQGEKTSFLQSLIIFVSLLWTLSRLSASFFVGVRTVLHVWPAKCWAEWDNCIS